MNLKKVRTKCNVKGCRNSAAKVDTYNVSLSKEFGASVIMCKECITAAYEALGGATMERILDENKRLKEEALKASSVPTENAAASVEEDSAEKTKRRATKKVSS